MALAHELPRRVSAGLIWGEVRLAKKKIGSGTLSCCNARSPFSSARLNPLLLSLGSLSTKTLFRPNEHGADCPLEP